jgi:enamine deaminase RidA (YjgF/YER057c/UK114 family)
MSSPFDPHRRHFVTGMAAVAAFGSVSAEAAAQGASSGEAPRHLRYLNPPTSPKNGAYTQAIEATTPGRILTISGQQGLDVHDNLVGAPGDFRAQAGQAFENIKGILTRDGALYEVEAVAVLPPA